MVTVPADGNPTQYSSSTTRKLQAESGELHRSGPARSDASRFIVSWGPTFFRGTGAVEPREWTPIASNTMLRWSDRVRACSEWKTVKSTKKEVRLISTALTLLEQTVRGVCLERKSVPKTSTGCVTSRTGETVDASATQRRPTFQKNDAGCVIVYLIFCIHMCVCVCVSVGMHVLPQKVCSGDPRRSRQSVVVWPISCFGADYVWGNPGTYREES